MGCVGLKLAVLEENLCHNHFDRALHNAGCAAGLQGIPTLAAAATSQCFSAAAHADGCGEGHIISLPDVTWGEPPFYASQMLNTNFLPQAVDIHATPIAPVDVPNGYKNLTVFAAASVDGRGPAQGLELVELVLRFVNDNNATVRATLQINAGGETIPTTAAVQTLTSPLFGTPMYDEATGGGWNSPENATFISTVNSTWVLSGARPVYEIPPKSFVVMRFGPRPNK